MSKKIIPIFEHTRLDALKELHTLSGQEVLKRVFNMDSPKEFIRKLNCEDFFWLVKKIGDDDSIPILQLASIDQWQYLIDLEVWQKDRLDLDQASVWIKRLYEADRKGFVRWLLGEGNGFAYYYFSKTCKVSVKLDDENFGQADNKFTIDRTIYFSVKNTDYRQTIQDIISGMADEDFERYQEFFLQFGETIPSKVEEELYRLKNVRLAEHGFLPYEEAVMLYSPLSFDVLENTEYEELIDNFEYKNAVAIIPLSGIGIKNFFTNIVSEISDSHFLNRLRIEFAGIANQIIIADRLMVNDNKVLVMACERGARIINLAIEGAAGFNSSSAQTLLMRHSLHTLFQVGFGMILKAKREAQLWLKKSWFYRNNLELSFWGKDWGEVLSGLLENRPQFYAGSKEQESYRDFETLSELNETKKIIYGLMQLDHLLEHLAKDFSIDGIFTRGNVSTFYPFLFNLWARSVLKLEECPLGLSLIQARAFLRTIRNKIEGPPFKISHFKDDFVEYFTSRVSGLNSEEESILNDALSSVWQKFDEEYAFVPADDLDARYSEILTVEND